MLPTIRSRCARLRLGPVGTRDIEAILADVAAIDPPVAARVARICGGRPGVALAWVVRPDALRERDAIGRTLLDLASARPAERLSGVRSLAAQAAAIAGIGEGARLDASIDRSTTDAPTGTASTRRKRAAPDAPLAPIAEESDADGEELEAAGPSRAPATERRQAAEALIGLWTDVARDLAFCQRGLDGSVRDLALLDDARSLAARLDAAAIGAFIDRLGMAGVLIAGNVSPELVLDDLALAWPRPRASSPRRVSDERLDATVRGRVQGVGFRYFVIRRGDEPRVDRVGLQRAGRHPSGAWRRVREPPWTHCSRRWRTARRGRWSTE